MELDETKDGKILLFDKEKKLSKKKLNKIFHMRLKVMKNYKL